MNREPGSQWKAWVYAVAILGGVLLGRLVGVLIVGAFLAGAGIVAQTAVGGAAVIACGGGAVLVTALRLRRLERDP